MENILVTGGAGFIGSNFIQYLLDNYPTATIVNVDILTYAGRYENIKGFEGEPNYHFVPADIRNRLKMREIFQMYDIDTVVNFAAESHVDCSIANPHLFYSTNVLGTQSLLDAALNHWRLDLANHNNQRFRANVKFLQVSTHDVYATLPEWGLFTETTPLQPNSPYSASKASADMLVWSYHHTFGMPINITRCSNNYGPNQLPKNLIPDMISQCIAGKKMPIYADGLQVRDWLHVSDHCCGIDFVLQKGEDGEVYNISGNNKKTNLEIAQLIINALGKSFDQVEFIADCPGHDRRYAVDNTKITTELGWEPLITFEEGIQQTIHAYLKLVYE